MTKATTNKAYALWNSYASETDTGFANTWSAYVFDSVAQRDAWLETRTDMASRACTRAQAVQYLYNPYGNYTRGFDGYLFNPVTDENVLVQKARA